MAAAMGVHRPTALVMGTLAGAYYVDAVGDRVAIANLAEWRGATSIHPTLNIPVFISTDIDKLDDTSGNRFVFGVCNATPGVVTVISKIKARQYDDPNLGAQGLPVRHLAFAVLEHPTDVWQRNLGVMRGYMDGELISPLFGGGSNVRIVRVPVHESR